MNKFLELNISAVSKQVHAGDTSSSTFLDIEQVALEETCFHTLDGLRVLGFCASLKCSCSLVFHLRVVQSTCFLLQMPHLICIY